MGQGDWRDGGWLGAFAGCVCRAPACLVNDMCAGHVLGRMGKCGGETEG